MRSESVALLEADGWEIDCEHPFEISTKDGSSATGQGAVMVLAFLEAEERMARMEKAVNAIAGAALIAKDAGDSYQKELWANVYRIASEALVTHED